MWICFTDGVEGEVDLGHLIDHGVFRIWRDRLTFERVHVGEFGELSWGEGVDLSLMPFLCGLPVGRWPRSLKLTRQPRMPEISRYELGKLSEAKAAEFAGLSRYEFIHALARFEVSPIQETPEELAEGLACEK